MPILIFRRDADQKELLAFLQESFPGDDGVNVTINRGRYRVIVPRELSKEDRENLQTHKLQDLLYGDVELEGLSSSGSISGDIIASAKKMEELRRLGSSSSNSRQGSFSGNPNKRDKRDEKAADDSAVTIDPATKTAPATSAAERGPDQIASQTRNQTEEPRTPGAWRDYIKRRK